MSSTSASIRKSAGVDDAKSPAAGSDAKSAGADDAKSAVAKSVAMDKKASPADLIEWAAKVAAVQSTRDPAKVERAKQQSELRSRAQKHYKTASRLQSSNVMSSHAYASAMRKCATVSAPSDYRRIEGEYAAQSVSLQAMMHDASSDEDEDVYEMRNEVAMSAMAAELDVSAPPSKEASVLAGIKLKRRTPAPPSQAAPSAVPAGAGACAGAHAPPVPVTSPAAADEEDEVHCYQLDASEGGVSKLAVAAIESNVEMLAQTVVAVDDQEMISLLDQLKIEPAADDARAALFKLYEANHATVEAARTQLFTFWAECEPDFGEHSMVKAAIGSDMNKIDSQQNMGVDFEGRYWFVHAMSVQVTKNNATIDGVLRMIRTKLELLGSQDECPICLDSLEGRSTVALGCAHACCARCWNHWETCCTEQGKRPFCPLCKNEAFIQSVCTYARVV